MVEYRLMVKASAGGKARYYVNNTKISEKRGDIIFNLMLKKDELKRKVEGIEKKIDKEVMKAIKGEK